MKCRALIIKGGGYQSRALLYCLLDYKLPLMPIVFLSDFWEKMILLLE